MSEHEVSSFATTHLVKVENDIQLADVAKVAVQDHHEMVDRLEHDQLVVILVDAGQKVERRVPERGGYAPRPWRPLATGIHAIVQ